MRYVNFYLIPAIAATIAIAVMWAVSALANVQYGSSLGSETALELWLFEITPSDIFANAFLASDILKTFVLFLFGAALISRQWMPAAVVGCLWMICTACSIQAATGFVALNQSTVMDSRGQNVSQWSLLQGEIKRTQERRSWVPDARPIDTVRAEIVGAENHYLYGRTKQCADATVPESIKFCNDLAILKRERANAEAAAKLDSKLEALRDEQKGTKQVSSTNPWAEFIVGLIGVKLANVTTGQALFIALLLEFVSGPALWAVWTIYLSTCRQAAAEAAQFAPSLPANDEREQEAGTDEVVAVESAEEPADSPKDTPPPSSRFSSKKAALGAMAKNSAQQDLPANDALDDEDEPEKIRVLRPEVVDEATSKWISARAERRDVKLGMQAKYLYADYEQFCRQTLRIEPVSDSHFGRSVKRLGVKSGKISGILRYGLKLKAQEAGESTALAA